MYIVLVRFLIECLLYFKQKTYQKIYFFKLAGKLRLSYNFYPQEIGIFYWFKLIEAYQAIKMLTSFEQSTL